ncbi:MAG: acetate--CoA ligase family protein [Anaerolineales bacterium]
MLEEFFTPKSVAVIGASTSPEKLGYAVLENLVNGGYVKVGKIYPINPKADEILGQKAYPSVLDVPDDIDLAVIVIPYPYVPAVLKDCGKKNIAGVVVISAGFREAGMEGLERELELVEIANEYKFRLIGPNCLGIIDTFTPINASFSAGTPPQGPMAFMSQSGALGTAILDWAQAGRLGLAKFVSLGNKADVSEIDLLKAWANDEDTNVILMYSEGLPNGQEFIKVAREVTKTKPVVAIKSGVTKSGSRAVSSHTGSLAGSEQAYQAAFQQAGVLRANDMASMFDMALALGYQPLLKNDRIVIVTNAGGPGILATDALERSGMNLARLKVETIQALEQYLPDAASAANPVDVLGDARADRYRFALESVSKDPNVDGIMVVLTPQAMTEIEDTARAVGELSQEIEKPILACFMGEAKVELGIKVLREYDVPNFSFPESASLAFQAMSQYRNIKERKDPVYESFEVDNQAVKEVLERAKKDGRYAIGDSEAWDILKAYGLSIPKSVLAKTPQEAIDIAGEIGYPVVLKIASPDILHKTDVGGVKVGLETPDQLRDAFDLMIYRIERFLPDAQVWGCQVQEMAPPGGLEVLIGMNRDPQFGPLVTFGLGGIYVEALKDVTFRVAPFTRLDAEAMLNEIRSKALLEGVRGKPPVDKEAVVDTLLRMGQLVQEFSEIAEFDINPLIVYPKDQGAIAIDMRLVLSSENKEKK